VRAGFSDGCCRQALLLAIVDMVLAAALILVLLAFLGCAVWISFQVVFRGWRIYRPPPPGTDASPGNSRPAAANPGPGDPKPSTPKPSNPKPGGPSTGSAKPGRGAPPPRSRRQGRR
jgi:hypothetical protein